jgi:histidine triad (HIT) family protein
MESIFTKIIQREIPAYIVYEDENFIAFLDIFPIQKGHTLLVPKKEIDYLFQQNDEILALMLPLAKRIASAIEKVITCNRIGLSVLGLEVPHAHLHLIPITKESDLSFSKPKLSFSKDEFEFLAYQIKQNII